MERKASCTCGQLNIIVTGEPTYVIACSCLKCQKRSGSVLGVSSYFDDSLIVEKKGNFSSFEIASESGSITNRSFCPNCGSTVYWKSSAMEQMTGIPVGAFGDPEFPEPMMAAWNQSRHPWVTFPEHWPSSNTQDFSKQN